MKKFFSLLFALVIALGLCACRLGDYLGRNKEEDSSTRKVEMITDGTPFSDGVAVVAHHSKRSGIKFSVIDKEGYILGDLDFEDYNLFHEGKYYYINGVLVYGNQVYDKTGKLIASPETTGYTELLTDARCDGKMLAVKIEETTSGEKYYFGVLDNKGNWTEALSDTHPIAKLLENNTDSIFFNRNQFCSDDVVIVAENCYYNMKTGAATSNAEEYYGTSTSIHNGRDYVGEHYEVFKRDVNGNETKIKDGVYMRCSLQTGFIGGYTQSTNTYVNLYYFDENGNEIIDLNTEHVDQAIVIDGYLFVLCDNGRNDYHTCVYKITGETVIESLNEHGHLNDLRVWAEYGLFGFDANTIYNFDGEKIEFENYVISSFGEGLFYVVSKEDYHRAYLDVNGNRVL